MCTLNLAFVVLLQALCALVVANQGALVEVSLSAAGAPWKQSGQCMMWDSTAASDGYKKRLAASICSEVRVPYTATYHVIADVRAATADAVGAVRLFNSNGRLLEWRRYYVNHELGQHGHDDIKHYMTAGTTYKLCFGGRNVPFQLCALDLYACQFRQQCHIELASFGVQSLSRRGRR